MAESLVELSIVTPVYQAEAFIEQFYRRMCAAAEHITPYFEIVFVDDGSTDRSLEMLLALRERDKRVVVIDLVSNRGQIKALYTGLANAKGKLVFTIDDDLEEEPEWLGAFCRELKEKKTDIVFGAQLKRRGNWLRYMPGQCVFIIMNKICRMGIVDNVITARLMTRRAADSILANPEHDIPYCLMCYRTGLPYSILHLKKLSHHASRYSTAKRIAFAYHYFLSYWQFRTKLFGRKP